VINLSKFNGKNIRVDFGDGAQIEAVGEEYMYGEDYEEEYNSLALRVTKVIKDREIHPFRVFVNSGLLTAIYENENVRIEEI